MATLVAELFAGAGYTAVKTFQDYAGRDRVVIAENSVS
jgi:methylase of polypeptide subunit release factors